MLTRREWGLSTAAALSVACSTETKSVAEPPAGPLYFDLHIDTPMRMLSEGLDLGETYWWTSVDIPKMKEGGLNAGFFAVFSPAHKQTPLESVKEALKITDLIVEEVNRHSDHLFIATTSEDVLRAQKEHKVGILLGVEGGHMIDSSIEVLRQLYRLGTRYLGLTHSGNTPWIGASEYEDGPDGLTDFGGEIVREMNRLGMMIDMAHASEKAFYDVIDITSAPILDTHTACRSVSNHPRNFSDDMLKKLSENGGVLGIPYYAGMLDDTFRSKMPLLAEFNEKKSAARKRLEGAGRRELSEELWKIERAAVDSIGQIPLSRLVDHIEHAATVAGIDHVGLGSDFDAVGLRLPAGLEDIAKTPNLIKALKERGFSDNDVDKVMGRNALRVMQAAEGVAE